MIERDDRGRWRSELEGIDERFELEQTLFSHDPLELRALDPQVQWAIVKSIHRTARKRLPNREHTIQRLAHLNPDGRPLFAIMCALALTEKRDIRKWDTERLHDFILHRELSIWREAGARAVDRELLAISTLCGGLDSTKKTDLECVRSILGSDPYDKRIMSLMTGRESGERIPPLEPGILGEYFVLEELTPPDGFSAARAPRLVRMAYEMNTWNTEVMISEMSMNFPRHNTLPAIVSVLPPEEGSFKLWPFAAVHVVSELYKANRCDDASAVYQAITERTQVKPAGRCLLVMAQGWMMIGLAENGRFGEMPGCFDNAMEVLHTLDTGDPYTLGVVYVLAGACLTAVEALAQRDLEAAMSWFCRLEQIQKDYGDHFSRATVVVNPMAGFPLESFLPKLRLGSDAKLNRRVFLDRLLVRGISFILKNLTSIDDCDKGIELGKMLEDLAKERLELAEFRGTFVAGVSHLISYLERVDQLRTAVGWYRKFDQLRLRFGKDAALFSDFKRTTEILTGWIPRIEDIETVGQRDALLAEIASEYPGDASVAKARSLSLFAVFWAYSKAGDEEKAKATYGKLKKWATAHPNIAGIQTIVAVACMRRIQTIGDAGSGKDTCERELARIVKETPKVGQHLFFLKRHLRNEERFFSSLLGYTLMK